MTERIYYPNIAPIESVLDEENDLKTMYDKVVKKKNYYLLYQFDPEKDISLIDIQKVVKRKYKEALFYIIEKKDNGKFDIVIGDTLPLNENSFKTLSIDIKEIDLLRKIDLLNQQIYEFNKKIIFFINTVEDEEEIFLKELNAQKANINDILKWIFTGTNFISKYKLFIVGFILGFLILFGTNYLLNQNIQETKDYENNLISNYQNQIYKIKKEIDKLKKENQKYVLPKTYKIYKG